MLFTIFYLKFLYYGLEHTEDLMPKRIWLDTRTFWAEMKPKNSPPPLNLFIAFAAGLFEKRPAGKKQCKGGEGGEGEEVWCFLPAQKVSIHILHSVFKMFLELSTKTFHKRW